MNQFNPPRRFFNQASGLNNDGSMPDHDKDFATRSATHDEIANPNEG